jgi:OOP family OmpA-OmpF porin
LASDKKMAIPIEFEEEEELKDNADDDEIIETILNVQFDFDSYEIRPDDQQIIENVIHIMEENPDLIVTVIGHTDNWGSDTYNLGLSQYRSNSVINAILAAGISKSRIEKEYLGESRPIKTNKTDEGRARNRRVEFLLREPVNH